MSAVRLEPLALHHASAILAGQDDLLAREAFGALWTPEALAVFLARAERWRPDGPIQEFAALAFDGDGDGGAVSRGIMVGGGGIHRLGPGLERHQAGVSYWLLPAYRGRGLGHALAADLVQRALALHGVSEAVLLIDPANLASQAVARHLGALPAGLTEPHPAGGGRRAQRWVLEAGD